MPAKTNHLREFSKLLKTTLIGWNQRSPNIDRKISEVLARAYEVEEPEIIFRNQEFIQTKEGVSSKAAAPWKLPKHKITFQKPAYTSFESVAKGLPFEAIWIEGLKQLLI